MHFITGSELKEWRQLLHISQTAMAAQTGVSSFRISQFECGYKELTEEEMIKLQQFMFLLSEQRAQKIQSSTHKSKTGGSDAD